MAQFLWPVATLSHRLHHINDSVITLAGYNALIAYQSPSEVASQYSDNTLNENLAPDVPLLAIRKKRRRPAIIIRRKKKIPPRIIQQPPGCIWYQCSTDLAPCGPSQACSNYTVVPTGALAQKVRLNNPDTAVPVTTTFLDPDGVFGRASVMFQSESVNLVSWPSGTWTIRLRVNTGNPNITWDGISICRMTTGCVPTQTIGFISSGLGFNLIDPGVYQISLPGAASIGNIDDCFYIVLGMLYPFPNSGAITFVFDQIVDNPLCTSVDPPQLGTWQIQRLTAGQRISEANRRRPKRRTSWRYRWLADFIQKSANPIPPSLHPALFRPRKKRNLKSFRHKKQSWSKLAQSSTLPDVLKVMCANALVKEDLQASAKVQENWTCTTVVKIC